MAEQVNYNKAFDQRLFGKDTKKSSGKEPENKEDQPPLPQPTDKEQQAKPQPEYKFLSVKIKVPSEGIKQNQPFDFQGEVQPLAGKINKSKVWIKAVAVYKGVKDVIFTEQNNLNIDSKTNTFQGTVKSCHFHDEYLRDNNKPADAKFELHIVADGTGADKEYQGESIKLPMEIKQYILKKGTYDKTACDKEANLYKLDGPDFIPDNKITKLQDTIAKFRLKENEFKPGVFDNVLDAAVRKFQDFAKRPERKICGNGRVFKAEKEKLKFDGATDGEVGQKTEDEIAVWIQNKYVKPDIELRKGDVDDHGVQNGKGKQGSDEHHPGSQLLDIQTLLADVNAYLANKDGWFWDKMEAGVKLFQEHAEKGEFLVNGVLKDIGEKLTGHRKGVVGQETVDYLKKVKEKGGKVPVKTQPATKNVKDLCEKHWEAHKNNCSGFVKEVAKELNVTLTGQANDIVDQIQKAPWKALKDGKEADTEARAGKFVVAGLKDDPNGHVVIIVPGELAHGKYPTAYWGHLGSVGYKNTTINYSWNSTERDKVTYASIRI